MFKADGERREFPLRKPKTVVGRKNTCDLRIPLSSVSRQHFQIELDGKGLVLRDLGSSNGTYYNDERATEARLAAGDQIRVGPVTFIVVIDGQPEDVMPVTTVLPEDTAEIAGLEEVAAAADLSDEPSAEPEHKKASGASQAIPIHTARKGGEADEFAAPIEEESHSPTVDVDEDDPIAALEALAAAGGDDEDIIPLLGDDFDDEDDEKTK